MTLYPPLNEHPDVLHVRGYPKEIPPEAFDGTPWKWLILECMHLMDMKRFAMRRLSADIARIQTLERLSVIGFGLSALPDELENLPLLRSLDLQRNSFARGIPEVIFRLHRLETLKLGRCNISMLPDTIADLQQLRSIDLEGNFITALPEAITTLQHLDTINLRNNPLTAVPAFPEHVKVQL